jgi:TonB family protein
MKHFLLSALLLACGLLGRQSAAQTPQDPLPDLEELTGPIEVPRDTSLVFTYVEQMPALPVVKGAQSQPTINQRLQQLVRLPPEVRAGTVQGTVVVSFMVRPDGYIRTVQVTRGLSPACDAAARRAVAALPRLVPGYQNKHPVKVSLSEVLNFAPAARVQSDK